MFRFGQSSSMLLSVAFGFHVKHCALHVRPTAFPIFLLLQLSARQIDFEIRRPLIEIDTRLNNTGRTQIVDSTYTRCARENHEHFEISRACRVRPSNFFFIYWVGIRATEVRYNFQPLSLSTLSVTVT